jgi:beta-ureidopropionase / N-carbamoyl-L-amino-acid hydrolase
MLADFNDLAFIGATEQGGVSRLALSNEDLQARAWLADRFMDAGLTVQDDDAGNLSGILPATEPNARTLLIGGHLDSVPNGGRYDCSLGLLAALEAVRTLGEAGVKLPVNVEIIDFTDEEGCWQSLFGSRALAGVFAYSTNGDEDHDEGPFRAALFRAGIHPGDIYRARRDPATIAGYLELHIEQGRRLEQAGMDIGVVTGIVGRTTYHMTFHGQAGHSGTTPFAERRDALRGAASYITRAFQMVEEQFPKAVLNCGNVIVSPGAFNIIPEKARLTVECRHIDRERLGLLEESLTELAQTVAGEHQLGIGIHQAVHMPVARMHDSMIEAIRGASDQLGCKSMPLVSYAGHDAQIISAFTRAGMIFVPSVGGNSHTPREYTEWRYVEQGANVLLHSMLRVAQGHKP